MTAMYQAYFGLAEAPFSIAPSPRYLYMSQRHQEALAHLLYGLEGDGGFVLLTGEVGTGKTTVCRSLLEQMPESCDVAYIFNPGLTVEELLSTICTEFGIDFPAGNTSIKVFVDFINQRLLETHAQGRHAVLIIDEAQNLSPDVLEQMRLLTNLETSERKLLQIILIGQPELAAMLDRPELRQLAQRIVARYHLGALTKPEVAAYIRHRLDVAGCQRPLFPPSAISQVYRLSGGIPRLINLICDRALLGTYVQGREKVDRTTIARAAREVLSPAAMRRPGLRRALAASLLLLAGGALAFALYRAPPGATGPGAAAPGERASASLDWPATAPRAESKDMAYAALFRSWGASFDGRQDACRQASSLELRCRTGRGGLDELRRLNRPAVLRLKDAHGQEFDATLTALGKDTATFEVAGQTRRVALSALATQWSGDYSLLWRAPPAVQGTLGPGDRGSGVIWLRGQLARLHATTGNDRPEDAELFDDALVRQVKQFQLRQGLLPDGRVGANTLIRLVGAADHSAPSLTKTTP